MDYNVEFQSEKINPYKLITKRIDTMKIKPHHKTEIIVNASLAQDLDIVKETAIRAGIIIYTKKNNITYFCLGVDTKTGNLTDFGGGVKKDETVINGALRELEEESQGIFGHIDNDMIKNSLAVYCYNMAVIFVQMDLDIKDTYLKFDERIRANPSPEVSNIAWLSKYEFMESINDRRYKMYSRVRKLLNRVVNIINEL